MKVVWMRSNAEGITEFVDLEFDSSPVPRGLETDVLPVSGAIYRTAQPAVDMDYHNAPRRQFVIPLDGEVVVGSGSGDSRRIGPGDALLADDLTGQGHTSIFRPDDARTLFLLVPDDLDPMAFAAQN